LSIIAEEDKSGRKKKKKKTSTSCLFVLCVKSGKVDFGIQMIAFAIYEITHTICQICLMLFAVFTFAMLSNHDSMFCHIDRRSDDSAATTTNTVYLDYAGSALPTAAQLTAVTQQLQLGAPLGNPHSSNASASRSSDAIERARELVLAHCGVSARTHAVVFVANATAAAKLVADCTDWHSSCFVYSQVNHTSLLGLRATAHALGARCRCCASLPPISGRFDCVASVSRFAMFRVWLAPPPPPPTLRTLAGSAVPCNAISPARCTTPPLQSDSCGVRVPSLRVSWSTLPPSPRRTPLDLARLDADFVCLSHVQTVWLSDRRRLPHRQARCGARPRCATAAYFGGGTLASLRIDRLDALAAARHRPGASTRRLRTAPPNFYAYCGGCRPALRRSRRSAASPRLARARACWPRTSATQLAALAPRERRARRHALPGRRRASPLVDCCVQRAPRRRQRGRLLRGGDAGAARWPAAAHRLLLQCGRVRALSAVARAALAAMERAQRTCGDDNDVLFAADDDGRAARGANGRRACVVWLAVAAGDAERVVDSGAPLFRRRRAVVLAVATPRRPPSAAASIAELWIYPIKSCAGVRVRRARVPLLRAGLKFDREFVVVDDQDVVLSQKRVPRLALVQPVIDFERETLTLTRARHAAAHAVAGARRHSGAASTTWSCVARERRRSSVGTGDEWFSQFLGRRCRLARQPAARSDWRTAFRTRRRCCS
jgi:hypothetical protein